MAAPTNVTIININFKLLNDIFYPLTTDSNKVFIGFTTFKLKYATIYKTLANCACNIIRSYEAGAWEIANVANGCGPEIHPSHSSSDLIVIFSLGSSISD